MKVKSNDMRVSKFLFILRNKNYVRYNSLNKKLITFSKHKKWFQTFLQKKKYNIYNISKKRNDWIY